MMHAGHMVLAVVGQGSSGRQVVAYAAREATARGSGLEILHVTPVHVPSEIRPRSRRGWLQAHGATTLERARCVAMRAAPDLSVTLTMVDGSFTDHLLARVRQAPLIVIGDPAEEAGAGMCAEGRVTAIVMAAPCPVVVVSEESGAHRGDVGLSPPHGPGRRPATAFAAVAARHRNVMAVRA